MNSTIIGIVIALASHLPTVIRDAEAIVKKIEADPDLLTRAEDAANGLIKVLEDLTGAGGLIDALKSTTSTDPTITPGN